MDALAAHYWHKPETSNCTIIVPVPRRRPGLSDVGPAPRMTLRLHKQFLLAKSLLLRGLLSGVSPTDLIQSRFPRSSTPLRIPHSQLPRILPSSPSHPVLFLPVPDPSSIQLLFQWMYFGKTDHIEHALERGDVRWDGLARNAEYLGLPLDIKVFLGRWYRLWHLPAPSRSPCHADEDEDEELDEDADYESESESDVDVYYSSASQSSSEDEDVEDWMQRDDAECDRRRGRTRNIKPLVQLCGQLRLRTT